MAYLLLLDCISLIIQSMNVALGKLFVRRMPSSANSIWFLYLATRYYAYIASIKALDEDLVDCHSK
jgi:hypothetical protein